MAIINIINGAIAMNKSCNLITAVTLLLIAAQQNCLATDFDPLAPPASSVSGAGGNNAGEVTMAIQQSDLPDESKHINVLYKDGAMVLSGTVGSDRDREEIGAIAEKCGCVNIRNEITVKGTGKKKKVHQAETITVKH
jgi:hypothetical protein